MAAIGKAVSGAAIAMGLLGLWVSPAAAQLNGSYMGTSLDADTLSNGPVAPAQLLRDALQGSEGETQRYQARLDFQESPLSLRGTLYRQPGANALVPSLTYDLGVGSGTNVYAGAGYALIEPGAATAIGDQNGLVLSAGSETELLPGLIIYGDVQWGVNTDATDGSTPLRLQLGIGRQF